MPQLERRKAENGGGMINGLGSWDPYDTTWNRKLANGVKKVLVLRVEAADSATTASESQLADDIFGAAGDPVNLKSQYNRCSYGQLQFEPATSNSNVGSDGVYTVTLPATQVTGADEFVLVDDVINEATRNLGTLTSFADYVMVCLPPVSRMEAAGIAYINYWLSFYDDDYCRFPYTLMHEIGELCSNYCDVWFN
jgi:hypothetical protein